MGITTLTITEEKQVEVIAENVSRRADGRWKRPRGAACFVKRIISIL
jgi:hypothetical protein